MTFWNTPRRMSEVASAYAGRAVCVIIDRACDDERNYPDGSTFVYLAQKNAPFSLLPNADADAIVRAAVNRAGVRV